MPSVEGKEPRLAALKARCHEHQIGVHGEMCKAPPEGEKGLLGVAVVLVLLHRVFDRLPLSGVFNSAVITGSPLTNRTRSRQLSFFSLVMNLPHYAEDVGPIQTGVLFVKRGLRPEVGEFKVAPQIVYAFAQDIQSAALFQSDRRDASRSVPWPAPVLNLQLLPRLCLRRIQELEQGFRIQAECAVIAGCVAASVSAAAR